VARRPRGSPRTPDAVARRRMRSPGWIRLMPAMVRVGRRVLEGDLETEPGRPRRAHGVPAM